jgi:hypothetical protein
LTGYNRTNSRTLICFPFEQNIARIGFVLTTQEQLPDSDIERAITKEELMVEITLTICKKEKIHEDVIFDGVYFFTIHMNLRRLSDLPVGHKYQ